MATVNNHRDFLQAIACQSTTAIDARRGNFPCAIAATLPRVKTSSKPKQIKFNHIKRIADEKGIVVYGSPHSKNVQVGDRNFLNTFDALQFVLSL